MNDLDEYAAAFFELARVPPRNLYDFKTFSL